MSLKDAVEIKLPANHNSDDTPQIQINPKQNLGSKTLTWRGVIFALVGAFFFALTSVLLRKCQLLSSSEQALIRFLIQLIVNWPIAIKKKYNILGLKGQRQMLSVRSFIGTVSLMSKYASVKFITPSDASALFNCFVIFVAVFSRIFLKEKLTIVHLIGISITILGIMFISQPEFLFTKLENHLINVNTTSNITKTLLLDTKETKETDEYLKLLGVGLALLGSLAYTAVYLYTKKLTNLRTHISVIMIYVSLCGIAVSLSASLVLILTGVESYTRFDIFDPVTRNMLLSDLCFALISSCFGTVAQLLLLYALKFEDVNKVSLLESNDLIFNFVLQYLILGIQSNYLNIIGTCLIFLGVVFVMCYKIIDKNEEEFVLKIENKEEKLGASFCKVAKKILFFKF
jgi:drug/metabolite transporter (DMT)-like permease